MTEAELCMLLECILALLETGNSDKAAEILRNGILKIGGKKERR